MTDPEQGSTTIQVNLDFDLLSLLKEVFYLSDPPFLVRLPDPARLLLRNIDDNLLRTTAARLETIVSRYNAINQNIQHIEVPLFERKLAKINEVCNKCDRCNNRTICINCTSWCMPKAPLLNPLV